MTRQRRTLVKWVKQGKYFIVNEPVSEIPLAFTKSEVKKAEKLFDRIS